MRNVCSTALAFLLWGIAVPVFAQTASEAILESYLREPTAAEESQAREVVQKAQVIILGYVVPEGEPDSLPKDARPKRTWYRIPTTFKREDGSESTGFKSPFCIMCEGYTRLNAADWLADMRKPLEHGCELQTAEIVPLPPLEVREHTCQLVDEFIEEVARKLEARKNDFPELRTFDASAIRPDPEQEGAWPSRPHIDYLQDVERQRTIRTLSSDWCILYVSFSPRTGRRHANPVTGHKNYPQLSGYVNWAISTENSKFGTSLNPDDPFLSFADQTIRSSLAGLDAYVASLESSNAP